jgi:hypothetical protein
VQLEKVERSTWISRKELKDLSAAEGPCITIALPLHKEDERQIRLTVKKALRYVEQRLEDRKVAADVRDRLMEPLRYLPDGLNSDPEQRSVVILRSPDVFKHFFVPSVLNETIAVADRFQLLPLVMEARANRPFYVLALSQKHIRLLRCTHNTSEEVDLPASVPRALDDFLQMDQPDHMLDNSVAAGVGSGSGTRVMFGTGTDKERKDQYLLHFYKAVDSGVVDLLKDDPAPLIIAGVEYELAIYRNESKYPRLADDGVRGAPDGLKGGELHKRALEIAEAHFAKEVDEALAVYERFGGSDRASVSMKEIVKGAHDGRVLHLFVAEGEQHMGNFDELTHRVRVHRDEQPGDEDIVNAAAVETLRHGGDVLAIPRNKIPHGSQMAAVMRY